MCGGEEKREGKGGKYLEKEKIIFFVEERKNGERKGGKYLERENVTMAGQTTNFLGEKFF